MGWNIANILIAIGSEHFHIERSEWQAGVAVSFESFLQHFLSQWLSHHLVIVMLKERFWSFTCRHRRDFNLVFIASSNILGLHLLFLAESMFSLVTP